MAAMKTRHRERRSGINEWGRDHWLADGDHTCRQTGNASLYHKSKKPLPISAAHMFWGKAIVGNKAWLIEEQLLASSPTSRQTDSFYICPSICPSLLQGGFILITLRGLLHLLRIYFSTFKLRLSKQLLLQQEIGFRFQSEVREQPITAA